MISFIIIVAFLDGLNEQILVSIYLLSSKRPIRQILLFCAVIFVIYFVIGCALTFGLGQLIYQFLVKPTMMDYILEACVGVILIVIALQMKHQQKIDKKEKQVSQYRGIILGAIISVVNIPVAFPYYAVIAKMITHQSSLVLNIGYLVLYNFVYLLPNLVIVVLYIIYRQRIISLLLRYQDKLSKFMFYFLKSFFLLLGIFMVIDVLFYVITGTPII